MAAHSSNLVLPKARGSVKGFTLLELMLSMFMLLLVTAAVFEQISQMQKKSSSEAMKVDLSQQGREFVDQTVRDLHMAGYPGVSMYSNADTTSPIVAAGLVRVSSTEILFEGDVNNDGNVYSVDIQYLPSDPNNPNCPCITRGAVPKAQGSPLNQATSATPTEIDHVFPPGTGAGQSGEDLFAYYDQNGNPVNIGAGVDISSAAGVSTISTIKTIKVNLSQITNLHDPATSSGFIRTSISATSRVNQ